MLNMAHWFLLKVKKVKLKRTIGRLKFLLISLLVLGGLYLTATGGSLTPSASPAGTFHTLAEIWNSIAATDYDSSSISASTTGSLLQGLKYINNNLFWASTSGNIWTASGVNRIGIGTSTPTTKLEVQGTSSASYGLFGALQIAGFTSQSYSRFGTSTTTHSNYISAADDLFISGDLEGRGSISFAGTASFSNTLWVSPGGYAGNVGIGTTAPSKKLTVWGSILASSSVATDLILRTSDANGGVDQGQFIIRSAANNAERLEFRNGSSDVLLADLASTSNFTVRNGQVGEEPSPYKGLNSRGQVNIINSGVEDTWYLSLGRDQDDGVAGDYAWIDSFWHNELSPFQYESRPLILNPSGGNVGIGVSAGVLSSKFQVRASVSAGIYSMERFELFDSDSVGRDGMGIGLNFYLEDDTSVLEKAASISIVWEDETNGSEDASIRFLTAQAGTITEAMRIDDNGRIGIGDATPRGKFSIVDTLPGSLSSGSFAIRSSNTIGSVASISATSLTSGNLFSAVIPAADTFTGNAFKITDTSANTLFRIEQEGTLVASGAAQFGGATSTASYSRFGTSTTTHSNYISAANDLFISGDLEGRGSISFAGTASISGNLRLPTTTATSGSIYSNTNTLLHTYGTNNLFLGVGAGNLTNSGTDSTGIGTSALRALASGRYNTALGTETLYSLTGNVSLDLGFDNTAVGYQALYSAVTANGNTAIGSQALRLNTGNTNTAVGQFAVASTTGGASNSALGSYALFTNQTGSENVAIGEDVLYNTTADSNTALGWRAGYTVSSGTRNVFIGNRAGYYETGSDRLFIDAGRDRTSQANARTTALIYGVFANAAANQMLTVNGRVGIGTTASKSQITVVDTLPGSLASGSFAIRSSNTIGSVASISATSLTSGTAFALTIPTTGFGGNIFQVKEAGGNLRFDIGSGGEILASGAAQFGSAGAPTSVSYSRFGTSTTTHSNYISAADDLFISGDLEVTATAQFNSFTKISSTMVVNPETRVWPLIISDADGSFTGVDFYICGTSCGGYSNDEDFFIRAGGRDFTFGHKHSGAVSVSQFIIQDDATHARLFLDSNSVVIGSFSDDIAKGTAFFILDPLPGTLSSGSFAIRSSNTIGSVASISATSLTTGTVLQMTVPASTSSSARYLLIQDTAGAVYASMGFGGRFAIRGSFYSHGANTTCTAAGVGCIDYAENFPTTDTTLAAGDVVSVVALSEVEGLPSGSVVRASSPDVIIGVISTNPAALITGESFVTGSLTGKKYEGQVPIALAGRVPVKFSNENGEINPGDRLTLSKTKPGYGEAVSGIDFPVF